MPAEEKPEGVKEPEGAKEEGDDDAKEEGDEEEYSDDEEDSKDDDEEGGEKSDEESPTHIPRRGNFYQHDDRNYVDTSAAASAG